MYSPGEEDHQARERTHRDQGLAYNHEWDVGQEEEDGKNDPEDNKDTDQKFPGRNAFQHMYLVL